jgi:protein gp37
MPERLSQPLKRQKPTMYFVNSMSDLFHEDIPFDYIDQVFEVVRKTPQHTYQILTKRADRMVQYFAGAGHAPANAWIGVSVEDKKYGVPRIDALRQIRAEIRFLSVEPLLEDVGDIDLTNIHWVIVGGESGTGARPMRSEWVESVRSQCERAGVAFFFKQWGGWGADGVKRSKKVNGRELNGQVYNEIPAIMVV